MQILMLYTATMLSFISIGSSAKDELRLQGIWTDRRTERRTGDSYILP